jgi:hypothetical protein
LEPRILETTQEGENMKLGGISMFDGCRVPIPEGVAVSMGLREDTELSIGYWTDQDQHIPIDAVELVVSTVPFHLWGDIYECSIPLNHKPGSSARAAKALANLGGNILQSESTALGLMQTGYWTVITEFKSANRMPPDEKDFKLQIQQSHEKQSFLTQDPDVCKDISIRKLCRLSRCADKIDRSSRQKGRYAGSSIVLNEDTCSLLDRAGLFNTEHGRYVFLSADTEERMLTLCFLRGNRRLYHIHLLLKWQHAEIPPTGLFGEVAQVLHDTKLNILRSYNYTLKKEDTEEISTLRFIVEGPVFRPEDLKQLQVRLLEVTHNGVKFVSAPEVTDASDLWALVRNIGEPLIVIPEEVRMPKCFLARLSNRKTDDFVNKIRTLIKDNGFLPWEVDPAALGQTNVAAAVLERIRQCCSMVMIIETHQYLRQRGSKHYEQTVSPWLVAEDAMAQALDMHVFRLKEDQVTHMTFNRGADFIPFDKTSPDQAISELNRAMKLWKTSSSFMRQLRAATRRGMEIYRRG